MNKSCLIRLIFMDNQGNSLQAMLIKKCWNRTSHHSQYTSYLHRETYRKIDHFNILGYKFLTSYHHFNLEIWPKDLLLKY